MNGVIQGTASDVMKAAMIWRVYVFACIVVYKKEKVEEEALY